MRVDLCESDQPDRESAILIGEITLLDRTPMHSGARSSVIEIPLDCESYRGGVEYLSGTAVGVSSAAQVHGGKGSGGQDDTLLGHLRTWTYQLRMRITEYGFRRRIRSTI